ncbi:monoamine oxidase [Kibdelosporangium banguiense]|uniref:Monoamine oxidase n=1 Tax=Kibdelosporangium banguiense TaxID=1365924 RepID=A0ABS4T999_9PSEU|nr:NAD(P)/FAD-dependent oxidoreductase [Kibdelosporangium banguiense]MBP2320411.1 monoamine oxidase [Kibdelosporangium banguiense]
MGTDGPRFTRRQMLIGTAAVTATAVAVPVTIRSGAANAAPSPGTVAPLDAIVLGAGMAGLAAARDLADRGKNVVVLEARDRIGGRMWTDRGAASIPVERGAELVHGADISTWPLIRGQGLATHEMKIAITRRDPGDPWEQIPPEPAGDFRVIGGYDQILRPLTGGLTIQLNTVIRQIEYGGDGVVVRADQAGTAVTFQARAAVVALPLGVLRSGDVTFSPALPEAKVAAMAAVRYHSACKVLLEFPKPVLPLNADNVVRLPGNPDTLWNSSTSVPGFTGQVVTGWSEGDAARELLALPAEARHKQVLEVVRAAAGEPNLMYSKVIEHDWVNDPFARGAYPLDVPGEDEIYRPVNDKLFWAGVVTPQIDLSYDSGRKAATELLQRLPVA